VRGKEAAKPTNEAKVALLLYLISATMSLSPCRFLPLSVTKGVRRDERERERERGIVSVLISSSEMGGWLKAGKGQREREREASSHSSC
jgi:hypothetical protein